MHYDEYLRLGYGIGSGAVESAHKQVVQALPSGRHALERGRGAAAVGALRLLLLNDQWAFP
jgi:hypothetical protein